MHRVIGDDGGARGPDAVPDMGAGPAGPPTLDKHLLDYLRVLVKRRWIVLAGLVVTLALAGIHAYTATPIYQSTVQLLIEHDDQSAFSLRQSASQDTETTDFYNTQFSILGSRAIAKRAIEAIGAWNNAELLGRSGPADLQPTNVLQGLRRFASDSYRRLKGGAPASPEAPAAAEARPTPAAEGGGGSTLETPRQAAVIDAFLSRVTVAPVETSRLVDVKFRAAVPRFASDAANAIARVYIEQNLEVRLTASKETTDWLTDQLAEQRRRIETSEKALQAYRENNNAISLDDRQNIVVQKLNELNAMVTRAKADRIQSETLYQQVVALKESGQLDALPSIFSNAYLQQLKNNLTTLRSQQAALALEFGDKHPKMEEIRTAINEANNKLRQELLNQVASIENDFEAAKMLETSLTSALESQKQDAVALDRTGIDYSVLEREVATNREIFDSLLERTREKDIVSDLRSSQVRVIDAAQVPRGPIWPNRFEIMVYAGFFGLLFGVVAAMSIEYLNDRIKTPDEVKSYLGLPVLGLVPLSGGRKDKTDPSKRLLLGAGATPLFAEAFRAIRTKIIFSAEDRQRCLVVTSTGPGEGKTLVSSNLAVGLAMTGQRVLLLDVDMRRPQVHETFGVPIGPGLSDLLIGTAESRDVLREASQDGLWLLTSGNTPENPAELLSSPRFSRLLTTLKEHFDWIILDSPPVAAVTDACIVANRSSAVLFVVGAELTSRAAAATAVEHLDAAGAVFVGAILNRVKLQQHAYYYSSYYRPAYDKYQNSTSSQR